MSQSASASHSDDEVLVPVYAIDNLIRIATREGVSGTLAGPIAHLQLLARRQGVELPLEDDRS